MKEHILIVEDDIAFLKMLSTFLERQGYEVSGVSSVQEAKLRIEETDFPLIITDLKLPDDTGISLLEYVKESAPGTGVILMT